MTVEQVKLVQITFEEIKPVSAAAAQLFYSRLFQLCPSLRQLFPVDIQPQRQKLIQALSMVVGSLETPEDIIPAIQAMAKRHSSYGVRDEDYAVFGAALLWTLEQALGPSWNAAVREAWTALYESVARVMKSAASQSHRAEA